MPPSRKAKGRASTPIDSPIEPPIPPQSVEVQDLYRQLSTQIQESVEAIDPVRANVLMSVTQPTNDMRMALGEVRQGWQAYLDSQNANMIDALGDAQSEIMREIDFQVSLAKGQLSIGGMDMHQAASGILMPPFTTKPILDITNRYPSQEAKPDIWLGQPPATPTISPPYLPPESLPIPPKDSGDKCWPKGKPSPELGSDQNVLCPGIWNYGWWFLPKWYEEGKWYCWFDNYSVNPKGPCYAIFRCSQYKDSTFFPPFYGFATFISGGPFNTPEEANECCQCMGGGIPPDGGPPPELPTPPPEQPPTPQPCVICQQCPCQCQTSDVWDIPPEESQCIPEENIEIVTFDLPDGSKSQFRRNAKTGEKTGLPNCPPPQDVVEKDYKKMNIACPNPDGSFGQGPPGLQEKMGKQAEENISWWRESISIWDFAAIGLIGRIISFLWDMVWGKIGKKEKKKGIVEKMADETAKMSMAMTGCNAELYGKLSSVRSSLAFAQNWVGTRYDEMERAINYRINYYCQSILPSASEANIAYLANTITYAQWETLIRANGVCLPWEKLVMEAGQAHPNGFETVQLYNREQITAQEFHDLMRKNGYIDTKNIAYMQRLSEYVPGPGDLVSFMTRDVFDKQTVEDYQLDKEFERKFQGQALKWAKANGMDEDQFKYYWRAHWQMPSPQQLFEMLHRLRPGEVPPDQEVTEKMVYDALGVNDYSPIWREKLMGISYHPLTRIDARHAYTEGIIDKKGMISALRDEGYSPANAEIMFKLADLEKTRNNAAHYLMITAKEAIHDYQTGLMSREDCEGWLEKNAVKKELWQDIFDSADVRRGINSKRQCIQAIEKRFDYYEMDYADAVAALISLGLDNGQAIDLVTGWSCHRASRSKMVSASQLCKFFSDGLITGDEYYRRLLRIGYDEASAQLIMAECNVKLQEKLLRQVEKLAKEQAKEEEKARREAERRKKEEEKKKKEELKKRLACMSDEDRQAYESAQCAGLDASGRPSIIS